MVLAMEEAEASNPSLLATAAGGALLSHGRMNDDEGGGPMTQTACAPLNLLKTQHKNSNQSKHKPMSD